MIMFYIALFLIIASVTAASCDPFSACGFIGTRYLYWSRPGTYNDCVLCSTGIPYAETCWCKGSSSTSTVGTLILMKCMDGFVANGQLCELSNCAIVSWIPGQCSSCQEGYYLTSNTNVCMPCAEFCKTCSSPTSCLSCNSEYYYLSTSNLCVIYNCASMSGQQCTLCSTGFYSANNGMKCLACTSPCSECTGSPTTCNTCIEGFTLQGSKCYIPQCAEVENSRCKRCNPGYFPGPGTSGCLRCSANCATCSGASTNCQSCPQGMGLDTSSRKCVVYHCRTMSGNMCTQCDGGYYADGKGTACLPCSSLCATCHASSDRCTSCNSSYVLSSDSACVVAHCIVQSEGACRTCDNGYYRSSPLSCRACSVECAQCSGGADLCTACSEGFLLQNSRCVVPNCASMRNGECEACISGFYRETPQVCTRCQAPCAECAGSPTHCTGCYTGYSLSGGQCVVLNCERMAGAVCKACVHGFFASSDGLQCSACALNCATCAGTAASCTSCTSNLMLDEKTRSCVAPNCEKMDGATCAACQEGFYPSVPSQTCVPCNAPCQTCLGGADVCTSCSTNYTLWESGCIVPNCARMDGVACDECVSGHYLAGPLSCKPCQEPCTQCAGSATNCTVCPHGFVHAEGKCRMPHCATLSGTTCTSCDAGFYRYGDGLQCLPCVAPCAACSGAATNCTECREGYSMDSAAGLCILPHCTNMQGAACARCASGYYLGAGGSACLPCTAPCATCTGAATNCLSCNASYTLQSNECIVVSCARMDGAACDECVSGHYLAGPLSCKPCQAPCATCTGSATQCTACPSGYNLVAGVCTVPNCATMDGTTCKQCLDGFYPSENNTACLMCLASCATCSGNSAMCTTCAEGYKMVSGTSKCFQDKCPKCVNGNCVADSTANSFVCQCAIGLTFLEGTCINDRCGACGGGKCVIDENFTATCDCGEGQRLFQSTCVSNLCGTCTNGACAYNNTANAYSCFCQASSRFDAATGVCVGINLSLGLRGGDIAAIVIFVTLGVILILLIIILPIKYCRKRREDERYAKEVNTSGFKRFSFGSSRESAVFSPSNQNSKFTDFSRGSVNRPHFN